MYRIQNSWHLPIYSKCFAKILELSCSSTIFQFLIKQNASNIVLNDEIVKHINTSYVLFSYEWVTIREFNVLCGNSHCMQTVGITTAIWNESALCQLASHTMSVKHSCIIRTHTLWRRRWWVLVTLAASIYRIAYIYACISAWYSSFT